MNAPEPVFSRIDSVFPVRLTVTRSRLSSWLKSPSVAVFGTGPVLTSEGAPNPPAPLPRRVAAWPTPLTLDRVTNRSGLPSLLTSATIAVRGPNPGDRRDGLPDAAVAVF